MDDSDRQLGQLVETAQLAQSDVETLLALHTPGAVIVNIAGRRLLGADDFRSAMEAALASPLADVTTTTEVHDIRYVRPDVAIISCTKHVTDARPGGGDLPDRGALTYVAVREGGTWRIALAQTTPMRAG
ncbi:SgcJ/EcaC family oxidoreductase [Pseudactinotalea terrae]|uniref:SgcJ/EcaC family oxidoreductase n=1 Tax=Pseudactinotalea terrae TaxID=1743262 RepID=UPI0012E1711A|nr:SgcJ/EcaC family oxidoreductase [Pseudactinotalea terrae]